MTVSNLKIPNEQAADHEERFVRDNYKFNFLVQIEVSAINGLSCREMPKKHLGNVASQLESKHEGAIVQDDTSIIKRSKIPLANIFFKVSAFNFASNIFGL